MARLLPCLVLILVFLQVTTGLSATPRTVRVGAFNYYPGIFRSDNGTIQGSFVDILKEIARKQGWTLEFVYGSWAQGLDRIRSGEVDVLTAVAKTDERLQFMDYTAVPLLTVWSQVYVRRESKVNSILEMQGIRVAVMKGDFNAAGFRSLAANFKIDCTYVEVPDFEAVFRAVETGQADAGVVNSVFGAGKGGQFAVRHTSVVFNPFDVYLTVAKGRNRDVLSALDSTMGEWQTVGTSFQQEAIERWAPGTINRVTVIPEWVTILLLSVTTALLLGVGFITLLRVRIRQATRKVKAILDALNDSLFVHEAETGRILEANACAERMYGYGPGDWSSVRIEDLSASAEGYTQEKALQLLSQQAKGVTQQFEWKARHRSGASFWVEVSMSRVNLGGRLRILVLARDITERKKSEEVLLRAQKLESLGVLAGGIAHDFNNLLGGIFGYLELTDLHLSAGKPDQARQALAKAQGVFGRARALTRQLLTFSKGGSPVLVPCDLCRLVEEAVGFALSGSNVQARFDVVPNLPVCVVDPAQISQVVDNLVINAKQAMPQGGVLRVRIGVETKDGVPYFSVTLADQGPGIPEAVLPRIFDPFFTTKKTGTGLGLAMCWSIVKRHRGSLEVRSEPGQGAEFRILLPWGPPPASQEPPPAVFGPGVKTPLRVLVMDDEAFNREILGEMLGSLGCEVETTPDGQAAVEAFRQAVSKGRPPRLVLLDRTVPGGEGGLEAARALRALDDRTFLVLMSGYSEEEDLHALGIQVTLPKPIRIEDLEQVIQALPGSG